MKKLLPFFLPIVLITTSIVSIGMFIYFLDSDISCETTNTTIIDITPSKTTNTIDLWTRHITNDEVIVLNFTLSRTEYYKHHLDQTTPFTITITKTLHRNGTYTYSLNPTCP